MYFEPLTNRLLGNWRSIAEFKCQVETKIWSEVFFLELSVSFERFVQRPPKVFKKVGLWILLSAFFSSVGLKITGQHSVKSVSRRGPKERVKVGKRKPTEIASAANPGEGKPRKARITGPPFVCNRCNASYSQRKTLWWHHRTGRCSGVPRLEKPKHRVIKGRYFCAHPSCVPSDGEFEDRVSR